jgi:hypothetical protein
VSAGLPPWNLHFCKLTTLQILRGVASAPALCLLGPRRFPSLIELLAQPVSLSSEAASSIHRLTRSRQFAPTTTVLVKICTSGDRRTYLLAVDHPRRHPEIDRLAADQCESTATRKTCLACLSNSRLIDAAGLIDSRLKGRDEW